MLCGSKRSYELTFRSDKESTVLSAVRTLRHLMVGVGYVANKQHQEKLAESRGIERLITLSSTQTENHLLRAEASYTMACAALGKSISPEFSKNSYNLDESSWNDDACENSVNSCEHCYNFTNHNCFAW